MGATLPQPASECCPQSCDGTTTVQVPGPAGQNGTDGFNGADGISPITTFQTADWVIPAELASSVATVADTSWMVTSQKLYGTRTDGSVHAFVEVVSIGGPTTVTLKNLEDAATSAYSENSAPGSTLIIGAKLMPAGIQGPSGLLSGAAAGGDLKGTYPNPQIAVGNTKGSSLWGNGTDTVAVPAGTNGHMLAYDSTDAEGVKSFKALPLTADTDVADNRLPRLDRPAGTEVPSPLQSSKVTVTDNGAIRADGSGGNARGTDAVDLQVTRAGATQVASGTNSTIGGGQNNTASNTSSSVAGGGSNSATGISSSVSGGSSNTASGIAAAVAGGTTNAASGNASFIGGGESNIANTTDSAVCAGSTNTAGNGAAHTRAFVGGGFGNTASGQESVVSGGSANTASAANSSVAGGVTNVASGTNSSIGGGALNTASGANSSIPGGNSATADKHGQVAHAAGNFASQGDAQASEFVMRNNTANATPTELFLDGAALRLTIPVSKSWMFEIMLVARTSAGLDAIYTSVGVIRNNAGTTSIDGVATTEIFDGASLPATPVVVSADDANDSLKILVTGIAVTNIRWVAVVSLAEVSY